MTPPVSSHHAPPRPVPFPSNPVLLASQNQWFFTDEELSRTPSQLDGMKFEAEQMSRSKGVNFITQVGIMLKLPQLTIATAAVYLHRFFMRYSMVDRSQRPGVHPYPIAATSLFLATKVEENVRRMREIVVACCRVAQKQPNLLVDEQSKEFWKWRDTILHHEDLLLEALCFDLQLEQPYRLLYDFICFFGLNDNKPLRNASWAFANDSMFTILCLQFHARTVAAAALYAAARHCDISFEDDELGRPWWEQIDVDLTQVRRACSRLAYLYESNAACRHSQHYPATPDVSGDGAEKTRRLRPGAADVPQGTRPDDRKRSREPDETQDELDTPNWPSANGKRSPKRQRLSMHDNVESKITSNNTISSQPPASISLSSHRTAALTKPPSDNQANGYPHYSNSRLPPQSRVPQRYQENGQLPQQGRDHEKAESSDSVPRRIDQDVRQNITHERDGINCRHSSGDHHQSGEQRLSTLSLSPKTSPRRFSLTEDGHSSTSGRKPQPSPPRWPLPQEPEDDGGGSEEGELA